MSYVLFRYYPSHIYFDFEDIGEPKFTRLCIWIPSLTNETKFWTFTSFK